MGIEYNECHYGGMYNINVKRIFVIIEFVHMNAGVSSEKEKVKESQSQSRSVTPLLDIHHRVPGRGRHNLVFEKNEIFMKKGKTVILSFCNSTGIAQGSIENSLDLG